MKHTHFNKTEITPGKDPEDLPLYWRLDLNINKIIDDHSEVTIDIHNLLNRKNHIPSLPGAEDGLEEPGISVLIRAGYRL